MESENKKKLPEFLKEKRQAKNLSLDKLSELTKIQVYHLEALEAGRFDKLPPAVYRAGLFKRLSKFLDIGENEIIEIYNQEIPAVETISRGAAAVESKKVGIFFLTPKKITVFFGIFLLISLLAYLVYQFKFLVGPPNLAISPKEDIIVKQESITVDGKTDSGIRLTINGENIFVSSDGGFSKEVRLADGVNSIEVQATNNFGKTSKIVRQIFRETP
ncbi:helix-turn-helix domain-containing protein [Candidatus Azambacteria bacterium]|nr:helix-turn-helix domain-containing protein [Candidatus Azambacteria bacterium]